MITDHDNEETSPPSFSLREIASWHSELPGILPTSVRASIPALQRGLVWKPQQNEFLWDSIFRGFPIGALVVTKWSEQLKRSAEELKIETHYHLLDGQQRCNAIALGFADPFAHGTKTDEVESILWIDLEPESKSDSTRNFWIRATTTSHPWGYSRDDNASRLPLRAICDSLKMIDLDPKEPGYRRPSPLRLWPSRASAKTPVPLGWVMRLMDERDEKTFWSKLGERAALLPQLRWTAAVTDFCQDRLKYEYRSRIFAGLGMVHKAKLVALVAPSELLAPSEQERATGKEEIDFANIEGISNIEQLFQRLNRQGTKLDGEELAYSMIKAYWPDLEDPINKAATKRMPQARMVSLGVRAALSDVTIDSLPSQPTVSGLRAIARANDMRKQRIQQFITTDLSGACDLVDQWLEYEANRNPAGLVPVLITSIAIDSRDIYLLLLHFAKRILGGAETPPGWSRVMQALATILHWFSKDKVKMVERVYRACQSELTLGNIRKALQEGILKSHLCQIHSPGNPEEEHTNPEIGDSIKVTLSNFIRIPESDLANWSWGKLIYKDGDTDGNLMRQENWEGFLNFRRNRELLIYAQRGFIKDRFEDYNPQRKDLWDEHDRPWDFDHILASKFVHNRKDGAPFRKAAGEWAWTIGNLRAWPAADNRSDQAQTASYKIGGDEMILKNSFMTPVEEAGFSVGDDVRWMEAQSREFMETCRLRLIKIYGEWYDSVGVAELVPSES